MLILTAGNLLQITLRGILFLAPEAFTEFYEAAYHSAVNFARYRAAHGAAHR
jgi:hypothetical protein